MSKLDVFIKQTISFSKKQESFTLPNLRKPRKIKKIIFVGMGGSGLGGRMVVALRGALKIKRSVSLELVQDYGLPNNLSKEESFVIITSYSGNTQETINCAKEAKKKGLFFVIISSNGKLQKLAEKWEVPFFALNKFPSARFSVLEQVAIIANILFYLKLSSQKLNLKISKRAIEKEINKSKRLVQKIKNHTLLIYAPEELYFLAYDLKIRLNEDGKILTFSNVLPEAIHNEFLAVQRNKNKVEVIFLIPKKTSYIFKKHLESIKKNFKKEGIKFHFIIVNYQNFSGVLSQIVFNISFSYFMAKKLKRDILENSFLRRIKAGF